MEPQVNRVELHADATQVDQTLSGMETGNTTGQQSQLNCNSPSPSPAVESPAQTEGASTQSSGDDCKSVCSGSGRSSRLKLASEIVAEVVNERKDDVKETLDKISDIIISGDYSSWNIDFHNKLSCRPFYTCVCGLVSYGPHAHCEAKDQVLCLYNTLSQIESWNIQDNISSIVKNAEQPKPKPKSPKRSHPSSVVKTQPKIETFENVNKFYVLETEDEWNEPVTDEYVFILGEWVKVPTQPNSQTPETTSLKSLPKPTPKPHKNPSVISKSTLKSRTIPRANSCRPDDSVSNSDLSIASSHASTHSNITTTSTSTSNSSQSLGIPKNNKIIYRPPWYKRLFTKKSVFDFEKPFNHELGQIPNKINKTKTRTIVSDDLIIPELYNHLRKHEFESYTNREAKMAHMVKLAVKLDLKLEDPLAINRYYATIQKVVDSVDTKFLLSEVNPTYTRSRLKAFFSKRNDQNFQ